MRGETFQVSKTWKVLGLGLAQVDDRFFLQRESQRGIQQAQRTAPGEGLRRAIHKKLRDLHAVRDLGREGHFYRRFFDERQAVGRARRPPLHVEVEARGAHPEVIHPKRVPVEREAGFQAEASVRRVGVEADEAGEDGMERARLGPALVPAS